MSVVVHPDSRRHTEFQPDNALGWLQEGHCASADPELFFPVKSGAENAVEAKAVCCGCPVIAACAAWVRGRPREAGVWAGTTHRERRALAKWEQRQALRLTAGAA